MDRVIDLIDDNTGSSDQESGSEPGSVKGRSVGRPVGHFRKNYFITLDDVPKKNNRVVVQCKFCHISMDSRADTLQDHILEHCKKVTQETRHVAEKHVQAAIKPTAGKRPPTSLSRTSSKKEKQEQQGASTGPMGKFLHAAVKPQQQIAVNRKLLRFLVLNGIPFRAVDSPFFLDFVGSLNITYTPAGGHQIVTQLHLCDCAVMHYCLLRAQLQPQVLVAWLRIIVFHRGYTAQDTLLERGIHCCKGHDSGED
jgi:hypothetical protein